ncbi:MAG: iron-sulfur cluster carrier protein MrpORP [Candidatus Muiribacteriota bacterium]
MSNIKNIITVLSGKGGVGKSTVAVNLAVSLGMQGQKTAILDVDLHGPSITKMLNIEDENAQFIGDKIIPAKVTSNLYALSIGMFLENENNPIIWRGPKKLGFIKQLIEDCDWGDLDYLIVDCPPGTGDEPLTVFQTLKNSQALIVTTPQNVALIDVKKSIEFCKQMNIPVVGIIENMSGFKCPECNKTYDIFKENGLKKYVEKNNINILAEIPIEAEISELSDNGKPFVYYGNEALKKEFEKVVEKILNLSSEKKENIMEKNIEKIGIPLENKALSMHFGHCEKFFIAEVDKKSKKVLKTSWLTPPEHKPEVIPKWLNELEVSVIITGGMGPRAVELFKSFKIDTIIGVEVDKPDNIIKDYLKGTLSRSTNACNH